MPYRRVQIGWITIIVMLVVTLPIVGVMAAADFQAVMLLLLLPLAILAAVLATFAFMTVTVDQSAITAKMGLGLVTRRVPLADIRQFQAVRNPWYYGWGVRVYGGGTLYNVSGLSAVELTLREGRSVRIGTNEPEAVVTALQRVIGTPAPLTPEEMSTGQRRRRVGWLIGLAVLALALALPFYARTRLLDVSVTATSLEVDSGLYGGKTPIADIRGVTLVQELPAITRKTNGFALLGTLRGHFDLDHLGNGELFVEQGHPPFVLVRTRNSFVAINFRDPARTRALYQQLLQASAPAPLIRGRR